MKIVIVNTFERLGGAAIAASRLADALKHSGIEVAMIVRDKQSILPSTISVDSTPFRRWVNKIRFVWERGVIFLHNHFNRNNLFAVSIANTGTDITHLKEVRQADIIHLHWVNQGLMSLKDIEKLGKLGKPIVWTMHDMWPATGICHHARECNGYFVSCSECQFTASKHLAADLLAKKRIIWKGLNVSFVACSEWLRERVSHSTLLQNKHLKAIPNPLDIEKFTPKADKAACRRTFGLPINKTLLLFGAVKASDKRKGIDYMIEAIEMLVGQFPEWKTKLGVAIFGNSDPEIEALFPVEVFSLSYIGSDVEMIKLYNAADLYVTSSLEENLPNTIMEAMACGLPCAGFNIGGIPEMITHKVNGYVAIYKSATDLAEGINEILTSPKYEQMKEAAREKVISHYSYEKVAQRYITLYNDIIKA